ncbi:flagellar export protein FliJ [Aliidiomarina sanyensis]|uniref:Flagellar FliJ protein n=1 Tax=Aliidiomarina sanyensis TaxID=1249555 RepID=A0A432WPY1_9GAMM|nr:flagellar export protein FliJ [Aliidiomarina sanyensis]RUO35821.1 flagellar export protein FliJ [Aliidiomarina sanyensis]
MTRSNALETLTDLAREARDKAGQLLASDRKNEHQILAHQEMLMNYRQEYADQLQQLMMSGIDPVTLYNYRQFLMSLDDSIQKASQALRQQNHKVQASKKNWQQEQQKLTSYTTLQDRRHAQVRQQAARQEQRQTDEFTTNRAARTVGLHVVGSED